MTSRQRVCAALRHQPTDAIPFSWGFGPTAEAAAVLRRDLAEQGIDWDRLRQSSDDVVSLHPRYVGPALPPDTDIWGIRRAAVSYGGGIYHELAALPLASAASPADVDAHPWPQPDWFDDAALPTDLARARDRWGDKAVRVSGGNPFEIYSWMTGLETALVNTALCPEVVARALEHIVSYFEQRLDRLAAALGDAIDLVFYADDLGGQQGLLLSRRSYVALLQPYHRRLLAHGKAVLPGALALYHSDGSVFGLLDDLLDAGIDVLEAVQTECAQMEPERLKADFGGRLGFHGGISVQQWLQHGDPAEVRRQTRRLLDVLGAGGGYVAAPSHAVQVGTPTGNVLAMLAEVLGPARFEAAVAGARA